MPFCSNCGRAVDANELYCRYCGSEIHAPSPPQPTRQIQLTSPKVSHQGQKIATAMALIVIIVSIIGLSLLPSSSSSTMISQEHTVNIVNGMVILNAGQYWYYLIKVPPRALNAYVSGTFTTSGGSGNYIEVIIMDSTNFINWQKGHPASTYYDSGQITTSSFDVSIPPGVWGTYYLVYSNTFTILSNKNVQTTVNLIYMM